MNTRHSPNKMNSVIDKCKAHKLAIVCLLVVWFFIPPLCGVYFFPPYNEPTLSGERGIGVIVLNRQKPMIFVLGHPLNTYTLHGLQYKGNGELEICDAKLSPFRIQFVESLIQYSHCRYICDGSNELLSNYSLHRPSLPTWLFITSIIIQIVLLIWGVSRILCYCFSRCIWTKCMPSEPHGEGRYRGELWKKIRARRK